MKKYKVIDAKVNKNLINDELTFHPAGSTGGTGKKKRKQSTGGERKTRKSTAEIVAETIKELVPNMIVDALKPIAATLKETRYLTTNLVYKLSKNRFQTFSQSGYCTREKIIQ